MPAVGQGALGLECRAADQAVLELILPLLHRETDVCVRAERAFNAYLEGGCQVPIAGHATLIEGQLHIEGRVGSVDGATLLKAKLSGTPEQAVELGEMLAQKLVEQRRWRFIESPILICCLSIHVRRTCRKFESCLTYGSN